MSKFQKTAFLGIMLGDGCLVIPSNSKSNLNIYFGFIQANIHSNYFQFVSLIFLSVTRFVTDNPGYNRHALRCYNSYMKSQYERWYPNGKKVIPIDLSKDENFSIESLIFTIMDDGTNYSTTDQISIALNAFTKSDLDQFIDTLKKKFDINGRLQPNMTLANGQKSHNMIIDTVSVNKLKNSNNCQELIVESMLYKFYNSYNIKECQKIDLRIQSKSQCFKGILISV